MPTVLYRLTKRLPAVRLCDKAKRGSEGVQIIEDSAFRGRRISGPAALYCAEGVVFESCSFYGNPDAVFCEYEGAKVPVGAIALRNVTFKDSDLKDISIIGRPDAIARLKLSLRIPTFEEEDEKGTMLAGASEQASALV